MIVRRMTVDDIPRVVEIDRSSFVLPWTERAFRYEVTENAAARCWVAESDDANVVSMLVLWMILDEAHIATVATHPHFRRKGFGRTLLTEALRSARVEGATSALLEVRASNVMAQKIYHGFGFVDVGRRPRYYHDNGEDAILMTLSPIDGDWL